MSTAEDSTQHFDGRGAALFLALLVAGDLSFIALHTINHNVGIHKLHDITVDRGYPEYYQYMKFFWICILLTYISLRRTSRRFIAWLPVFIYLLLDDALRIHERAGGRIADKLDFEPLLGLRLQDYGELAVTMVAGAILLAPLLWAYSGGSRTFRRTSIDIAILMAVLLFFGVLFDMFHIMLKSGEGLNFILGVIEDGGEMLSASLILWYVFLVVIRPKDNVTYLCDSIRLVLARRPGERAIIHR